MMMVAPSRGSRRRRSNSSTSSDADIQFNSSNLYRPTFTTPSRQRVCDTCHSDIQQFLTIQRATIAHQTQQQQQQEQNNVETSSVTSARSTMTECPVCSIRLDQFDRHELRESHLRECFEQLESRGTHITTFRYAGK
jgi:hypothetical protein